MTKPITVVIVTYQSEHSIIPALRALKPSFDMRLLDVVVVDNNSTDGTLRLLDDERDWVKVISTGVNCGFGRGCNSGFALVCTPYTVFVNPDASVDMNALRTLYEFMEQNSSAGIVGPAIIEGKTLQPTGARPTPWSIVRAALPFNGQSSVLCPIEPGAAPFQTGWVCGAVLMVRTDLMRQLGGFDPTFFLYWEETDLCKRAEHAGYEVWAVGKAVAYHIGGASSASDETAVHGCIAKHYYQSRYYYMVKHHGRLLASLADITEFLLLLLRSCIDAVQGKGGARLRTRLLAPLLSIPKF